IGMECQSCKERKATLHFTQVINGNKKEVHVCESCAKEKGYANIPEEGYSLHDLIKGFFSVDSPSLESVKRQPLVFQQDPTCPQCELTVTEFRRAGKFGCARCYETFSPWIDPILQRLHSGNTIHRGKIPKRKAGDLHIKKQIEEYRNHLLELIEEEAFEEAAEVRDKINALKEKQNPSKR